MIKNRFPKYLVPLRYTGGKSYVLPSLHEQLPVHFDEFRDPFLGGGSFPLSVMWRNKNARFWVNEGNPHVFNTWNNLHKNAPKMQKWIWQKRADHSTDIESLFRWCRENLDNADSFEQGCIWYILNRISYNGNGDEGCFTDAYHFTDGKITELKYVGELLKSVDLTITNYEYSVLLSSSTKNVFLFLDPPYQLGSKYRYGDLHRQFNHELFSLMVKDTPHKCLITYNDIPEIRQRFEGFNMLPLAMSYKRRGELVNELVIKNY